MTAPPPSRRVSRSLAVLAAAWLLFAFGVGPWVIGAAYRGEAIGPLNRLISGQAQHPVDFYLDLWRRVALSATAVLAMVAWAIPASGRLRHRFRERGPSSPVPALGVVEALSVAGTAALIGGLTEAITSVVRHRLTHLPTGDVITGEVFWMGPLAAATVLGTLALALLAIDRGTRGRVPASRLVALASWTLVFFGLLSVLKLGLIPVARWVLAAGLASAVARALSVSLPEVRRIAPRLLGAAALSLVGLALAVPRLRRAEEDRRVAAAPAPRPGQPNVVVLIWDTARAASMSLYGYGRPTTPNVDKWAAGGVVFDRAFATSSWSLPSHASIFTGRYPHELSTGFRTPLDRTRATIAEAMHGAGYATAGFTANLFYGADDYGIGRGFATYDARPPVEPRVISLGWYCAMRTYEWALLRRGNHERLQRRRADHVTDSFLSWLDHRGDRPFFAVLNHFDAHEPYAPPPPFNTAFSTAEQRYWFDEEHHVFPAKDLTDFNDTYDSAIHYLDAEFQRLLDALKARGVLDNTIVILTSDHGEEFGEHGPSLVGHMKSLYSGALNVPMVIVAPGRLPAGMRRHEVVSIRDIPATVLDLAGVRGPGFPGTSMAAVARDSAGPSTPRLAVLEKHPWAARQPDWPSSQGNLYSAVDGEAHYILDAHLRESLFDLSSDYFEAHDLAGRDTARVAALRAKVDATFGAKGKKRPRAPYMP